MKYEKISVERIPLDEFGEEMRKVFEKYSLLLQVGKRKEVFLLPKNLQKVYDKLEKKIYMAGFYAGEIKGSDFRISVELGEKIVPHNKDRRVWVNERGEQKFLYGRNIKRRFITRQDDIPKNAKVLVLNEKNDYLGLGIMRRSGDIKNVLDKGWYLRRKE